MRKAVEFLRLAADAFPPSPNARHCLTFEDGKCVLSLFMANIVPNIVLSFIMDDADLDREPSDVIADIRVLLERN